MDLVFTNKPQLFSDCSTEVLRPMSDHKLVNFSLTNSTNVSGEDAGAEAVKVPEIATFNFRNANQEELKEKLREARWNEVLRVSDDKGVETLAERFIEKIVRIAKLLKVSKFPVGLKEVKKSKQHLLNLEKRTRLEEQIKQPCCREKDRLEKEDQIKSLNEEIQREHQQERERKECEVIEKIKVNPKEFFKYANKTKKTRSKIGPLKLRETCYSGPAKMAKILSDQYKSVFSKPKDDYSSINFVQRSIAPLDAIILEEQRFVAAMESIKATSAPGPDGVPAYLYRVFREELATPVMMIWKHSMETGIMPEPTMLAYITPILKSVDRSLPANYRPVSLTNHLTKIFERVVRKQLVDHLESQGLMNKTQHGFRARHSTITTILF